MQTWNKDPDNPRVITVQDKRSRFVVDWKSRYKSKTMEYLQGETTFRQTEEDPNKLVSEKLERWLENGKGMRDCQRRLVNG